MPATAYGSGAGFAGSLQLASASAAAASARGALANRLAEHDRVAERIAHAELAEAPRLRHQPAFGRDHAGALELGVERVDADHVHAAARPLGHARVAHLEQVKLESRARHAGVAVPLELHRE